MHYVLVKSMKYKKKMVFLKEYQAFPNPLHQLLTIRFRRVLNVYLGCRSIALLILLLFTVIIFYVLSCLLEKIF